MRLIDADAMHRFVEEKVAEGKDGWANGVGYEWSWTLTAVDMQPTIDAVPVVRCKDCRNLCPVGTYNWLAGECSITRNKIPPDFFCAFGQRKAVDG